jgi:hypothetical protein
MARFEVPAPRADFVLSIVPKYAELLNGARFDAEAKPFCHAMCCSLAWRDELPVAQASHECRQLYLFLLSARTATLLRRNTESCDRLLAAIKPHLSDWAYFHESRWNPSLRRLFVQVAKKLDEDLNELEATFEARKQRNAENRKISGEEDSSSEIGHPR